MSRGNDQVVISSKYETREDMGEYFIIIAKVDPGYHPRKCALFAIKNMFIYNKQ